MYYYHINFKYPARYHNKHIFALLFIFYVLLIFYIYARQSNRKETSDVEGWSYNTSRDVSLYILPNDLTTLLLPKKFCKESTFFVVVVCSAPTNFEKREAIRETWGSSKSVSYFSTDVYFLVGETFNNGTNIRIKQEFATYNDIIQERFVDSYYNLTIKSLMMLKLVKTHCMDKIKYLIKSDDDMYINVPNLINTLKVRGGENFLMGYSYSKYMPIRIPDHKSRSPRYLYNKRYYPDFICGCSYAMSIDVVSKLYHAALDTPIFHLEDVYITGILSKAVGITLRYNAAFLCWEAQCCRYTNVITSHGFNWARLRNYYFDRRRYLRLYMDKYRFFANYSQEKNKNIF